MNFLIFNTSTGETFTYSSLAEATEAVMSLTIPPDHGIKSFDMTCSIPKNLAGDFVPYLIHYKG